MGLFKPAWMGNNEEKALKAVAKINDQAKLVKIVKETKLWRVKVAVVEKLTDQYILADIVKSNELKEVRLAAINNITDLPILKEIRTEVSKPKWTGRDMDVLAAVSRKLAEAENLTGEAMQKNIAEYGGTTDERITAIQQIDDQSFLISLAISDKDKYVRYEALQRLNKIGGSSLLVELIGSYKTKGSIRHHDTLENTATMLNLSDFAGKNNELSIIVEGIWDRNNQIAKKALDMITDKSVLMDLCNKKLYQGETGHERKGLSDKAKERLMGLG